MAKKSLTAKTRLFKIVMRWSDRKTIMTTRLYQSKARFDRSWKCPPYGWAPGAQYDAFEFKRNTWVHINKKINPSQPTWKS